MSWLDPVKRLVRPVVMRQAEPRPPAPEPPPAPTAPPSDAELFSKWWQHWRRVDAQRAAAYAAQVEQDAARDAAKRAAAREALLAVVARHGVFFPGDHADALRTAQQVEVTPWTSGETGAGTGGDEGPAYGWIRFPR